MRMSNVKLKDTWKSGRCKTKVYCVWRFMRLHKDNSTFYRLFSRCRRSPIAQRIRKCVSVRESVFGTLHLILMRTHAEFHFLLKPIDPMGRFAWHEEELGLTVCCIYTRVYPVWKTSLIKHCHFLTHIPCLLKDGVVRVRYTSGQIAVTKWLTDKQADSEADRSMHKYTKAWGKTALTWGLVPGFSTTYI